MARAAAHPVATLREYATALEAALAVCLANPRPGAVHDLRSATRRIEAQLELLALVPDTPRHGAPKPKLLKQLAKLRRPAGRVRDLDVQQRLLIAAFPHNVEAAALRAKLKQQREFAAAKLLDLITRNITKTSAAMEALLKALKPAARRGLPSDRLLHLTGEWFEARSAHDPEDEESLHAVRKAAKLARYLAESAPGASAKAAAVRYEKMQKAGGHWHDWLELSKLPGVKKNNALADHMRHRIAAHLSSFRSTLED